MTNNKTIAFASFAILMALAAGDAQAQIGGLIRKKAQEAIKGPEKAEEKKQAGPSPFNSDVLEITPPVFAGVVRGLTVEVGLHREFKAELAKYPTPAEYNDCQTKVAMSEESQKLMSILDLPDNATAEQSQAAMKKFSEEGAALLKRKCPLDPSTWSNSKKQERLNAIRLKAAEAAGPEGTFHDDFEAALEGGPSAWEAGPASTAAGLTPQQYVILLERIRRLCELTKDKSLASQGAANGLKVPGTGTSVFWVFTPTEVKVMDEKNCQQFYDLLNQLM